MDMVACRMRSRLALHRCLLMPLLGHRRESGCFSNPQLYYCTSELLPGDGVIELPHDTLLWGIFYNGGVSVSGVAIIIVEGIVEVRSEDCHVLGCDGPHGSAVKSHPHVHCLLLASGFSFCKEMDVFPCHTWDKSFGKCPHGEYSHMEELKVPPAQHMVWGCGRGSLVLICTKTHWHCHCWGGPCM